MTSDGAITSIEEFPKDYDSFAPERRINDLGIRSFRDIADGDYITARMNYRAKLLPQFLWSSQQALEKYLKAILLFSRVSSKTVRHDNDRALEMVLELPLGIKLDDGMKEVFDLVSTFGPDRYLTGSLYITQYPLADLDRLVWYLRQFCVPLAMDFTDPNLLRLRQDELAAKVAATGMQVAGKGRVQDGKLESIIADKHNSARGALIHQNLYFGSKNRKVVLVRRWFSCINSPLYLYPHMIDAVSELIFISKEEREAFRQLAAQTPNRARPRND
ncbi:MAG: HEPN domain-containing protein [Alcaligenaceae bacterium]|nr:MAG: HEPN domain-containing protein [Alcaligenaceae bacterium]